MQLCVIITDHCGHCRRGKEVLLWCSFSSSASLVSFTCYYFPKLKFCFSLLSRVELLNGPHILYSFSFFTLFLALFTSMVCVLFTIFTFWHSTKNREMYYNSWPCTKIWNLYRSMACKITDVVYYVHFNRMYVRAMERKKTREAENMNGDKQIDRQKWRYEKAWGYSTRLE